MAYAHSKYMRDLEQMIVYPQPEVKLTLTLPTPTPPKKNAGRGVVAVSEADRDADRHLSPHCVPPTPKPKLISRSESRSSNIPPSAYHWELMQLMDGWEGNKEIVGNPNASITSTEAPSTENTIPASPPSTSASILLSESEEESGTENTDFSDSTELGSQTSLRPSTASILALFHQPTPEGKVTTHLETAKLSTSPTDIMDPPAPASPSSLLLLTPSTNANIMSSPVETSNMESLTAAPDLEAMAISSPSDLKQPGLFVDAIPTIALQNMLAEGNVDMDKDSRLRFASATTLATRTTEDVIADLKRLHPVQVQDPSKRPRSAASSTDAPPSSNGRPSVVEGDVPDSEPEDDYEEEEEEDDVGPTSKPRKITERKRRMNMTVDNYLINRTLDKIKKGTVVRPEDEANQTTRWLVNQSENRQIISTPREYQNELFQTAKEKNIIAVLDTGSGKTLIAVLLLRHVIDQELEDRALGKPKRIAFFLVDSVTLVFQQHAVLKANLDHNMDMFCGDMGCDLWSKKKWVQHFANNMVIVCTAVVLRQCLHHSFISIDQINLLIFDEAHHAKKDHTYARIIKDFYAPATTGTILPKIFGMTASPVDARVDVKKAALELEAILHSQICTASDPDLMRYTVTKSQETIGYYQQLGPKFETPLYTQMRERFEKNPVMRKPLLYAYDATRELGSWCADQVWPFCLSEEETKKLQAKTEREYHAKKSHDPIAVLEKHKALLEEARILVKGHLFETPDYNLSQGTTSKNLSTKVMLLVGYLKERFQRTTDDKCIIFVKQRYTARLLAKLLTHPTIKTPYLHVGTLVGTRTGDAGDLNVSFREQVLTMMNFRKGVLNCLVATSVAEEGLDIPDCNMVIRFDLYTTLIQYIQSRGRARHANSRYLHMMEKGNQQHNNMFVEVRRNEDVLKRFCAGLPEDRKLMGNDFNMDYFLAKERSHRVYTVKSTGAKLNYKMALTILSNFVDSLENSEDGNLQAEYVMISKGKDFECEVILPEKSPVRGAVGRPHSTKQVAKCSAAFEACLELIKGKYLDEHLLPIFTKQLPAMRNAVLAVDSKKRAQYDMKTKPKLWSEGGVPEELYLTVITLDDPACLDRPSQPIALLTRTKLIQFPSFMLHFGEKHSSVNFLRVDSPLPVTSEMLAQINTFTLLSFTEIFSKQYESDISKMSYFIVPIKPQAEEHYLDDPNTLIDWDVLKAVDEHTQKFGKNPWEYKSWQTEPDEYFDGKFVTDPYDGSRKLFIVRRAPHLNATDPLPEGCAPRTGARKNNDNIMEYSCSLWASARERHVLDTTQRVFEAKLVSLRRNLLDEFDIRGEESSKCFITMQMLLVSGLPSPVVAMTYCFPAIIHRLESYLIAMEATELLHLDIRPDLALEACTKDSDNSSEHDAVKINFQRGMGNNYERLEFLGDCFLKMATSISLYGLHPTNDEYQYHVDRMLLICNKNLCNNAIKLKLFEYIRSASFSRRGWYPEGLNLLRGKKVVDLKKSHDLGDKSIADVCEAMIGAALLTHHESGNMDNAVRAVTELVSSENHNIKQWSDYYKLYEMPKYQTMVATESQKHLAVQVEKKHAYHFKWPRVLRSAFIHPSYPFSYEKIPSYQRLEFLGDALLDMACINFLFHNHPGKDPQWLTEHKMAMASNQFLGALCVALEFHTHLLCLNGAFQKQITEYVEEIQEARRQAEAEAIRDGRPASDCARDYWVTVRPPPKCLPDIIEAYVGAIFVDSQYDYKQVERFFDEHIKWYFTDMSLYDTYANKHPTTFLSNFLAINMGCSVYHFPIREIPSIDSSKPAVLALVLIHGNVIAEHEAESSRYAKIGAAKKALGMLKGLPLMEYREKYKCDCKLEEVHERVTTDGEMRGTVQVAAADVEQVVAMSEEEILRTIDGVGVV